MNKNTRSIRRQLTAAGHKGQDSITVSVPVPDYHNHDHSQFTQRTIPTARADKSGLVSSNPYRNTCMRVLHNVGVNGKASLTVHEALEKGGSVIHKNHNYLEYRRPGCSS